MHALRLKNYVWRFRFKPRIKIRFKEFIGLIGHILFVSPRLRRQIEPGRFEEVEKVPPMGPYMY